MSVYLEDIPLVEAQERLLKALVDEKQDGVLGIETIALDEQACGRVLAAPVWARISSPHYHASAMDGFAVQSTSTGAAEPANPITLKCGLVADTPEAAYLDTGDPLPGWADAVVPIELVEPIDTHGLAADNPRRPYAIRLRSAVVPWQHIRPVGEDMIATQLVLPSGHTLRPVDLGAIAASGHTAVQAARRPLVAIIPTGSELVTPGVEPKAGEIIEFNSLVLAAQVVSWGGQAVRFPITPDDFTTIHKCVEQAIEQADLVLLLAGSSAGAEDFSAQVIQSMGELLVHGVAVRPGHPVILGMVAATVDQRSQQNLDQARVAPMENHKMVPVIGVPGYPVSAALTGEIFIEPLLARWCGRQPAKPNTVEATLIRKLTSPAGDEDYVRVVVGRVGEKLLAAPLSRGSGVITSLVRADGLVVIPSGTQGLEAGAPVTVQLYRSPAELNQTILAIGSHDMTLDLLAQFLAARQRRLASSNVGSLAGLIALRRGEAHLAGSHLLNPTDGVYNLRYIREYLPDVAVKVVAFVDRQQGLLVAKGNPKGIKTLADLARPDVTMINRQRGAGTRVLLDYHLQLEGIPTSSLQGYQFEQYSHLAVAASITSGRVDAGLGIAAAAQALGLDFIPLFQESYQLIIPQVHYQDQLLAPLLEILSDSSFQQAVAAMPGYNVAEMGKVVAELPSSG